jgi:hypothetical protein
MALQPLLRAGIEHFYRLVAVILEILVPMQPQCGSFLANIAENRQKRPKGRD